MNDEDIMKHLSNLHALARKTSLRETANTVGVAFGLGLAVLVLSLKSTR